MEFKQENIKTISGINQYNYLNSLDKSLLAIIEGFKLGQTNSQIEMLRGFSNDNNWNMDRLPEMDHTYANISKLINKIREEYRLLAWDNENEDVLKNRGILENISISSESGLPWVFDFVEIFNQLNSRGSNLQKMDDYDGLALQFKHLLMSDDVDIESLEMNMFNLHKNTMKRNFLETLSDYDQLSWKKDRAETIFYAKKIRPYGVEDLWNISFAQFSNSSNMFEAYSVDLWQDWSDRNEIIEDGDNIIISDKLKREITDFSIENPAWFVIRTIDDKFESLHPVHVSKCLVGPFENKYLTNPKYKKLEGTNELLTMNPDEGLFRFSRSYSYAPNQMELGVNPRQKIYRENWTDEIIACPAHYSSRLSESVLGTNVRIVEV